MIIVEATLDTFGFFRRIMLMVLLPNYRISKFWNFDKMSIEIVFSNRLFDIYIYCLSQPSNLEMSSDSIDEEDIPHFAYYLVLRVYPPFPTKIVILCPHAETNDIFGPGGRVGPSPITKMNKVEIFLAKTLGF